MKLNAATAAVWGITAVASAQTGAAVRIPRVSHAPALEEFLGGEVPEREGRIGEFRQRVPGDGAPASRQTVAFLAYDERNLYVTFVCRDDPSQVRAHLARREEISNDDQVAVYLDTFRDRQRAYVFSTNPLGVQRDGIRTEGQKTDYSFDTLWHSEGRLTADGFVVHLSIPFKSLRFPDAPVQRWGIALNRYILRKNEDVYWPYVTDRVAGFLQQMATADGLEQVSPGRNVQLIPYAAFAGARFLNSSPPWFRTQKDARLGLDSKIVLRDAFTFDVTLNPDFSQVESDDPQVTINQRFEVFFPEKRPFFIENAGFFQTPLNLFFSRRLIDPEFGARLTGKAGRWALGALFADDRAPGKLVKDANPLHDRRTTAGVATVRREFGNQSSVGVLATTRSFGSTFNTAVSLDTRLRLGRNWFFTGQSVRSDDRDAKDARRTGSAWFGELSRGGRKFNYVARYTDIAPDFRTQLGFIRRVDIRTAEQYGSYRWRPESKTILSFGPALTALVNWDRTGHLQDWFLNADFTVELPRQTELTLSRNENFEDYLRQGFRKHTTALRFYTAWLRSLGVSGYYDRGRAINYSPAAGPAFLGESTTGSFTLAYRPTPRFRLDEVYVYSGLGTRLGPRAAIFNNHLFRSRLNYYFTRALSLRAIADYYAVLPNPGLVSLDRFKRLSGDVLMTYLVNPGTALYVGYTDRYDNLAPDPATGRLVYTNSPRTSTARQVYVKLSYLLRF